MNNMEFRPDELVAGKRGEKYPRLKGRLRVLHEDSDTTEFSSEVISYVHMELAVVKATVKTDKGAATSYATASREADQRLCHCLLMLAESRAYARCMRFLGYGLDVSAEEMSCELQTGSPDNEPKPQRPRAGVTPSQRDSIIKIATSHKWPPLECCKRILGRQNLTRIEDLDQAEANLVIEKMKSAA